MAGDILNNIGTGFPFILSLIRTSFNFNCSLTLHSSYMALGLWAGSLLPLWEQNMGLYLGSVSVLVAPPTLARDRLPGPAPRHRQGTGGGGGTP